MRKLKKFMKKLKKFFKRLFYVVRFIHVENEETLNYIYEKLTDLIYEYDGMAKIDKFINKKYNDFQIGITCDRNIWDSIVITYKLFQYGSGGFVKNYIYCLEDGSQQ